MELGNRHLLAMFHTAVDLIGDLVQVVGVNDLVAAKGRLLDGALDLLGIETLDGVVFFTTLGIWLTTRYGVENNEYKVQKPEKLPANQHFSGKKAEKFLRRLTT